MYMNVTMKYIVPFINPILLDIYIFRIDFKLNSTLVLKLKLLILF